MISKEKTGMCQHPIPSGATKLLVSTPLKKNPVMADDMDVKQIRMERPRA